VSVELVHTFADDGLRLDGAVYSPAAGVETSFGIDGLLVLHGTGSNFYASRFLAFIAERAVGWGTACLVANTRGHDQVTTALVKNPDGSTGSRRIGSAYEKVDECRLDVRAWLQVMSSRGLSRLAILGHSLGAVKTLYAAANETLAGVQALVAVSPPRLSYSHFAASVRGPGFLAELAEAEKLIAAGKPEAIMDIHFPLPYLITAAGYVDKYGRDERYNVLNLVDRLSVPTLFTFGGAEIQQGIAFRGTVEALEEKKSAGANLTTAVIAAGDHHYTGVQGDLLNTIERWLKRTSSPARN
jgi:pimeloyl-ACP methyl ester carboxylesterase